MLLISLLALGGALAFGRATPPGLATDQLWPPGQTFTFNGTFVRVLGAARSDSCSGMLAPASAAHRVEDLGCGGTERGLFTDAHGDALVAVTVVAFPTGALAHDAAVALQRANAVAVPLEPPSAHGRRLETAGAAVVAEDVGSEVMVVDATHADGRTRSVSSGWCASRSSGTTARDTRGPCTSASRPRPPSTRTSRPARVATTLRPGSSGRRCGCRSRTIRGGRSSG
jgi:hypothetical protein